MKLLISYNNQLAFFPLGSLENVFYVVTIILIFLIARGHMYLPGRDGVGDIPQSLLFYFAFLSGFWACTHICRVIFPKPVGLGFELPPAVWDTAPPVTRIGVWPNNFNS